MSRQYSFPANHWNWPVQISNQHGVRSGEFIFTGGQVDLDPMGKVRHPGDLSLQCDHVLDYIDIIFKDLKVDFQDLVKLVIFYVDGADARSTILTLIENRIGHQVKPVINFIALPGLAYHDMMIEIEAVAMRAVDGSRIPRECFHLHDMPALPSAFSHAIRCNEMIFTSDLSSINTTGEVVAADDIVSQTTIMMDQLALLLDAAGSSIDDVVKHNAFYILGEDPDAWSKPAAIRAGYFKDPGPAATGIPVSAFPRKGQMTQCAATAMSSPSGKPLKRQFAWPEGHWDWTSPLPYKHGNQCGKVIHVGGQVSLDTNAEVVDPGNMIAQTRRAMENISRVLAEFNATLDDVIKVTTYYQGQSSATDLHENLMIRSNCYRDLMGPATTGVPVQKLIYDDMVIEIDVIAIIDD
jgi:enamine deaminase RidA (YjgF/YER057c/UK114 family)